ncbi:MAG: hypothetical protein CL677_00975 [Bdellovibrionaceae bacterium]|nr:hypothetical protein [Pseudobdellovibrionaceae bacterium]
MLTSFWRIGFFIFLVLFAMPALPVFGDEAFKVVKNDAEEEAWKEFSDVEEEGFLSELISSDEEEEAPDEDLEVVEDTPQQVVVDEEGSAQGFIENSEMVLPEELEGASGGQKSVQFNDKPPPTPKPKAASKTNSRKKSKPRAATLRLKKNCNLRRKPSLRGKKIKTMKKGSKMWTEPVGLKWKKIKGSFGTGYISSSCF